MAASSSKQQDITRTLMARPMAGSANPSVSLDAVWRILQPALDHFMHHSSADPTVVKPPALEPAYHMEIHTVIYNYFTSQSESTASQLARQERERDHEPDTDADGPISTDLYSLLDRYFQKTSQDFFQATPSDSSALLDFYVSTWNRYSASVHAIHRLLNYFNRHYVKRAQDEDRGWLRMTDVLDVTVKTNLQGLFSRDGLSQKLREKRLAELSDWGFREGQSEEEQARAETCAEAASPPDRIVHVNALGFRRWRIELVEPLLSVPKVGAKAIRGARSQPIKRPPALKSRLSRAVNETLESKERSTEDKQQLAQQLSSSLRAVGLRQDHPLRKRLEKHLSSK